jgi:hypothetical protein
MTEIIIAFLTGILGPIVVLLVKHILNTRKTPDLIAEAVNNANVINDEIEKIMEEFTPDRVWIAQFHNGGHYYPTGKSIQKFSIFFEQVKHAKDATRDNFQNIPVNLFSKSFSRVLTHDYVAIPDFKDETLATYGLKYIAEENGTKSSYIFAIRTVENRLIGLLGIDYTTRKKTLDSEDIIKLRLEATKLGGVLMSQL